MPADDFKHVANVCANLKTLETTIDIASKGSWSLGTLSKGRMARLLGAAPLLEYLNISFKGINVTMDDIVGVERPADLRDRSCSRYYLVVTT